MKLKPKALGWICVFPLGACLVAITSIPLGYILLLGFRRYYLPEETQSFIGFSNYLQILQTPEFWNSFLITVVFSGSAVFLHLVLGVSIALLLNQRFAGFERIRRIFRAVIIVPWLLAGAVAASIWLVIFHPFGAVNSILMTLGLLKSPLIWLGDNKLTLPTVIVLYVWRILPFFVIIILASMESIPQRLYEAASIDGAGKVTQFFYITLPYILPGLLTLGMVDTIWTFKQFDLIFLTTGGGPAGTTRNLPLLIYYTAFENLRFGRAAAQGILTFLFTLAFAIIYIKLSVPREIK